MSFDPYLYVALAAGFIAGRLIRWRNPWVGRATLATIVILVFVLGASLGSLTGWSALESVGFSIAFALGVLGVTLGFALLLPRPELRSTGTASLPKPGLPLGPLLVLDVVAGYAFGHFVAIPPAPLLTGFLYVLVALVAFDLQISWEQLRLVAIPVAAAVSGALVTGVVVGLATPIGLQGALATTLGFGWYTLSGPLVTARLGAAAGLVAFLTNFLRENFTMVLSPALGPRVKGEGLAAMGGATSMDTTLYFVTRYGDAGAGGLALATGLVLTIVASLVLPVVLGLG